MSATKPAGSAVHVTVLALITMVVSACSLPSSNTAPLPAGSYMVLTDKEIMGTPALTAYDAVARLRPRFLKSAGGTNSFPPAVYLNGVLIGGIAELSNIQAMSVREIRYLSSVDATMRYGAGRFGGALLVTTKSGEAR